MPQQLIYTSAPRGVIAGRSGHCTVARSAAMRDALMLQLEKVSYYQHLSLSGGQDRPIYCCRLIDLRGSRYHVLSRIQDAGLDFTGRTNFIAHHLVFAPEEIRSLPSPAIILRDWPGWLKSWNKDPELLDNEDWSSLTALPRTGAPAVHWQQVTGDAVNGYGLLEARAGIAFRVDDLTDEQVLALFAESLELLELRDPRRDFRAGAWQYTFTTSMQEQDNPADFRWRCLHSDNPAANRFAGPDCRALSEVRAQRVINEEALFARGGRQPPRFVVPPQNVTCIVGTAARLYAKAEGVPAPAYQWLAVDRGGNSQPIVGAVSEELQVQNPPLGLTRYAVRVSNSEGEVTSGVVTLSVEQKGHAASHPPVQAPTPGKPPTAPHIKSATEIEEQRKRLAAEQEKKPIRKWPLFLLGIVFLAAIAVAIALQPRGEKKTAPNTITPRHESNAEVSNLKTGSNISKEMPKTPLPLRNDVPAESNAGAALATSVPLGTKLAWPADWQRKAIGDVPYAHADCITNAPVRFFLTAAAQGLRTNGDNLLFACQTNSGAELQASVFAIKDDFPMPPKSMRGIMVRASDSPMSSLLFIGAGWGRILACRREPKGFFLTNAALSQSPLLPVILKFERRSNQIAAAYSFDHRNWMTFEGYEFPARDESLAGLAAWSGDRSNRVTARFVLLSAGEGAVKKD